MACLLRRRSCCVGPCQGLGTWRVAGSTQAREFGGVNDGTQSVGGAASQPLRTPPPRREARVHHLATTLCGGGAQLSTSCGSRLIRLIARCYLRRARRRPARLARMPPPRRPRISPPRLGAAGRRPRLACGGAPARPSPASRVRVRVRDRVRGRARARVLAPRSTPRKGTARFATVSASAPTTGAHAVAALTLTSASWFRSSVRSPAASALTAVGVSVA